MRGLARVVLGRAPDAPLLLAARALDAVRRRRRRPVALALVYHRIAPQAGDPSSELVPAIATGEFRRQLEWVRRRYAPTTAGDLLEAARKRAPGAPVPLAVTFDDDLETHHAHARPVLAEHRVPATFFLCGRTLDGPSPFWWEDLEAAFHRGALAGGPLPHLAGVPHDDLFALDAAIGDLSPGRRSEIAVALRARAGEAPQPGLQAAHVRALADAGHEIGFHTREHPRLPTLDDGGLRVTLRDGRDDLERAAGRPVLRFAYPDGAYDDRSVDAVREAGYATAFTTSGFGWDPTVDPLTVGRVEPRSPSLGVFALKLAVAAFGRG